jgi:competence ComEA-like helix-hairpin-helix protein
MKMRAVVRVMLVLLLGCGFVLAPSAFTATKKPPVHPIDINSASAVQLQEVPGIGPATAEKILQMRKSYGAFKSVDDLLSVRGIGAKRLEKMRKFLVAGHAAPGRRTGGSGLAGAAATAKPAACAGCAHGVPAKKATATVAPVKASKPNALDAEPAGADEEPE